MNNKRKMKKKKKKKERQLLLEDNFESWAMATQGEKLKNNQTEELA
jgi:hypothetical protein